MKYITTILFLTSFFVSFCQSSFQTAYNQNPLIPKGLLEAIAWNNTHMVHLSGHSESCSGIPQPFGIMGLFEDGKHYFRENAKLIALLSGISISEQRRSADNQIMAYAKAFQAKLTEIGAIETANPLQLKEVLNFFSEIPLEGEVNALARDLQVYAVFDFMNSMENEEVHNFRASNIDFEEVFGSENYKVLSSPKISISKKGIKSKEGNIYVPTIQKTSEYGPAIWNPAATCNFSSRNGVAISAITIHTIQGTYAGAISWAQNCASSVSYHYVIRSSDGQVTQMLLEEDKGWHVGSENPYTIGYEHEGYVDDASWYTNEMITSSADLSRDIVNSGYGIPPLRTYYGPASATTNTLGNCTKIKGHQHYPNSTHTDPGINWDWEHYYKLINNSPSFNSVSGQNGSFFDTGGAAGDYLDDEREFWLFDTPNALSVSIDFTAFDLESGYDNLFIYDGDSTDAPLLGSYSGTNSPGMITSTGPKLLVEFRSDCGVTSSGWEATYSATLDVTGIAETGKDLPIILYPNPTKNKISFSNLKQPSQISIINSIGQVCLEAKVNPNSELNISSLASGYYRISIVSKDRIDELELVITK